MTTSKTPTHGDADRWQLWAAAGSAPGTRLARDDELEVHAGPAMPHTDPVLSEMYRFAAIENASFTLPTRPRVLSDPSGQPVRVDLLADPRGPRRAPTGAIRGFAALTVLIVISCLVGGVTGALVVIGVSTLLAASAALVSGHISLSRVGGPHGAGLFLGLAVVALMAASVMPRDRPGHQGEVPTALVPISASRLADARASSAAVPPSRVASTSRRVAPAAVAPSRSGTEVNTSALASRSVASGGVLTLSPEALTPTSGRAHEPRPPRTATATKPEKPAKPAKPGKTAKPDKTAKADKTAKPAKHEKPSKPDKTNKRSTPANPATICAGRSGVAPVVLPALAALAPCGPVRQ